MITEDYVSFETAKLLKEKGFEQHNPDVEMYYLENGEYSAVVGDEVYQIDSMYSAPTLQMAMKWLREIHDIDIMIWVENYNGVKQYVSDCWKNVIQINNNFHRCGRFSSYNEACEAAIKYCLENLI